MAMRAVDLNLFVNSASKGWNDGAKVDSPFGAFLEGVSKGIDQNYENELKAAQTEKVNIENQEAPYREQILQKQAEEAKIQTQAMQENPDAFKDTIVSQAQTKQAAAAQAQAYESKKTKLTDIYNSGDGKAIGDAYLSGDYKEVFSKDPSLDKLFKNEYPNWAKESQDTYQEQQRALREAKTNESLYDDAVATYEKNKPDYVANPDINTLKQKIQEATGKPVADSDLFEKGRIIAIEGPKQIPQKITQIDPNTGQPVLGADNKTPNQVFAPPDKFGQIPYVDDPLSTDKEKRNVFQYDGQNYQIAGGLPDSTSKLFGTMQSSYRRQNYLDKGQGGTTDLNAQADQKQKAQTDAIAKSQADAAQTNEQIDAQRAQFIQGANVATQKLAVKEGIVKPAETPLPEQKVYPPGPADNAPPIGPHNPEMKAPAPTAKPEPTPQADLIPTPAVPQVLPTSIATPKTALVDAEPTPTPGPMTPAQQNQLIVKQAQAVKANDFLSKYQKPADKTVTPPVTPAVQATMTTASPYIPKNVSTNIPYKPDPVAINTVASRPEMAGLSAITKAVAAHESRGINSATSPTGVNGIMQVTGATGKEINPNFDRTNPVQQAVAGAITLSRLNEKYPNNPMLALTAYNGGTVVVNEAVRMAGTTDWNIVKDFIPKASDSAQVQTAWYNDFRQAGFSDSKARKLARDKGNETSSYAEKVIVNFPAFASNSDDNRLLQLLKQQGVFQT